MFGRKRECDVCQTYRDQRQFVGHRSHRAHFYRGLFEPLPLPTLDLTSAGEDDGAFQAGALAGAGWFSVVSHTRIQRTEKDFVRRMIADSLPHWHSIRD